MNNKPKNKKILLGTAVLLIAVIAFTLVLSLSGGESPALPTADEAGSLISAAIKQMPGVNAGGVASLFDGSVEVTVTAVEEADGGLCAATATVSSPALAKELEKRADEIAAIGESGLKSDGMKAALGELIASAFASAEPSPSEVRVMLVPSDGKWTVHASKELADAAYGGLASYSDAIDGSSEPVCKRLCGLCEIRYDASGLPDTRGALAKWWDGLAAQFKLCFIDEGRWAMILGGLGTTLAITLFAAAMGVVLGFLVAVVRVTHDRTGKLGILNGICKLYLTVIRGTPVLIQLMIIYFVILAPVRAPKLLVAILAFGINSGAYVAEIVRGGIMAVDIGQMEAGRSLGLNYRQTMFTIIIPQALKAILPALGNEFITLVKETSVSAYIALEDLTRAGDKIRGATYTAFMPLIAVALIYLAVVLLLTALLGRLERRMRRSDRG